MEGTWGAEECQEEALAGGQEGWTDLEDGADALAGGGAAGDEKAGGGEAAGKGRGGDGHGPGGPGAGGSGARVPPWVRGAGRIAWPAGRGLEVQFA